MEYFEASRWLWCELKVICRQFLQSFCDYLPPGPLALVPQTFPGIELVNFKLDLVQYWTIISTSVTYFVKSSPRFLLFGNDHVIENRFAAVFGQQAWMCICSFPRDETRGDDLSRPMYMFESPRARQATPAKPEDGAPKTPRVENFLKNVDVHEAHRLTR